MTIEHFSDAHVTLEETSERIEHAEVTVHPGWVQFHDDGRIISASAVRSIVPTTNNTDPIN